MWQTPLLGRHLPGRHPLSRHHSGPTPPGQAPPGRHPLGRHIPSWADTSPWADTPGADTPPRQTPPCPVHAGVHTHPLLSACWDTHTPAHCMLGYMPSPRGHCSERYASYWNAFLLYMCSLGKTSNRVLAFRDERKIRNKCKRNRNITDFRRITCVRCRCLYLFLHTFVHNFILSER